ncbi:MAG: nitric oxide reductase activation protein NorD [Chitinophagaceae bacterium]|nr:nitric oxide reductase activation protein NorD [Rubrivivax sp.]
MTGNGSLLSRRLEVLRGVDGATFDILLADPVWRDGLAEGGAAALVDLLAQVASEAPDAAAALALRLGGLVTTVPDPASLRKWALHGLLRHQNHPKGRLQYFERDDPRAFTDLQAEADASDLLAQRAALLAYLAGFGFSTHGIELHEPQAAGQPPPAPSVADAVIRFSRRCAVSGHGAERAALYRASMAHIAAHLRHSPLARLAGSRRPMLLATIALLEDARVERLMLRDYPGLRSLWGMFHTATREGSGFDYAGLAARLARALHDPGYDDSNAWVQTGRALFEDAAATDLHDVPAFEAIGRRLAIDVEKMRLPLLPSYRPQPPYRDDNAVLWNMNAALPIDEEATAPREDYEFRPRDALPPDLPAVDVDTRRRTRHPEWDHRLDALREDWATVIESGPAAHRSAGSRFAHRPAQRVRGLEQTPDRSIRLNRLAEGDELDLTAAVDGAIRQRARLAPDGRIFRRHGRRHRATAVVLLMDLSVSTQRFVPGSFTTVLDVEKRAARVVAQALDSSRDRVAVHGFASDGRHEVHYQRIKDFDEPFGAEQQARLAALRGSLSTRMGAALRHATALLDGQAVDHKVILMLTDGEPSDVDVVEEEHLVEDARHAVASAAARGIRTFCLTLDRHADAYVRRIFGSRNYLIADRADAFAGHTGDALVRLVAH